MGILYSYYYNRVTSNEKNAYWLESRNFEEEGTAVLYRPFGHHAKRLFLTPGQSRLMRECITEASVLENNSTCTNKEWPYIPLALSWIMPAIDMRVRGRLVSKFPD